MKCLASLVLLLQAASLASVAAAGNAVWNVTETADLGTLPGGGIVRRAELATPQTTAKLTAIVFQSKAYSLRVVDSDSPGRTKLAASLQAAGCVAGVNGGYFHEDFRPVGLVIENGVEIHPFERAGLLAGILALRGKQWEIVRSAAFKNSPDVKQAVQCGPMLVEAGHPTAGLNAVRSARRTIAATDGRGQWALIYLTSVTLAEAAEILLTPGVLGNWKPVTALNLDGGSSSGLWAASDPTEISLPEFGQVRNFVGIVPR
ncbi:MAG: phosphodiester glycosidase family protein [Chthoniobacterales bacterium]|nr:phosphodiester glycosidase family protein [Chthoniobacterales bacterium]